MKCQQQNKLMKHKLSDAQQKFGNSNVLLAVFQLCTQVLYRGKIAVQCRLLINWLHIKQVSFQYQFAGAPRFFFFFFWKFLQNSLRPSFNPLSANPTKWSNTLKQFIGNLPMNCLSVFDHFVKLALKGIIKSQTCNLQVFQIWSSI